MQAAADTLKQYEMAKDVLIAERAQQKTLGQQQLGDKATEARVRASLDAQAKDKADNETAKADVEQKKAVEQTARPEAMRAQTRSPHTEYEAGAGPQRCSSAAADRRHKQGY